MPGMAGSLAITGNLAQGSSGIVNMDIAGTTPGMQYDQLTVSGNATLNGTLNIAHVNEYAPSGGETFNVINSAGNTGSFAAINPPATFTYTPTYGATVFSLAFGSGPGTDSWLLNADGSWDDPHNWSLGAVPAAGQNVIINCPGSLCTVTIPVAYSAVADKITSNENLTIAGGNLSLTAGANSSLFGSDTTLYLIGGGTINIGSGATLTAYNLNLANGDIRGPGSLIVSNGFSQSAGGTIGNTTPVSIINITQSAGNLVIADLLKASGNVSLTAYGTINQTAPIAASGLELLGTGGTYNLNTAANAVTTLAGNTGSVNFTNVGALRIGTINGTVGLTTARNAQVVSGGDLTFNGLVDAGAGMVTLTAGGAMINGMGSSTSISAIPSMPTQSTASAVVILS